MMARLALLIIRRAAPNEYGDKSARSEALMEASRRFWAIACSTSGEEAKIGSLQELLEEALSAPAAEEPNWDDMQIIALLACASIKANGKLMLAAEFISMMAKLNCARKAAAQIAFAGRFNALKATGERSL